MPQQLTTLCYTPLINPSLKGIRLKFLKIKTLFITKRALAINIQEQDSLYLHADTLLITGPSDARVQELSKKLKFSRKILGKCDSTQMRLKKSQTYKH